MQYLNWFMWNTIFFFTDLSFAGTPVGLGNLCHCWCGRFWPGDRHTAIPTCDWPCLEGNSFRRLQEPNPSPVACWEVLEQGTTLPWALAESSAGWVFLFYPHRNFPMLSSGNQGGWVHYPQHEPGQHKRCVPPAARRWLPALRAGNAGLKFLSEAVSSLHHAWL